MLDHLTPLARHLALLLLAAVLTWAAVDLVPWLDTQHWPAAPLVSVLVTAVLAWATPLTRQYGVGAPPQSRPVA